jgi:DNA repair photolyase
MARHTLVTVAPRTTLITKSGFSNYDLCLNPYVGCEFKCQYCYVRFFVKDSKAEWGDFVRVREHMITNLPKELLKGFVRVTDGKKKEVGTDGTFLRDEDGKFIFKQTYKNLAITDSRLVIGTMTDPYQPKEVKYRITVSHHEVSPASPHK